MQKASQYLCENEILQIGAVILNDCAKKLNSHHAVSQNTRVSVFIVTEKVCYKVLTISNK